MIAAFFSALLTPAQARPSRRIILCVDGRVLESRALTSDLSAVPMSQVTHSRPTLPPDDSNLPGDDINIADTISWDRTLPSDSNNLPGVDLSLEVDWTPIDNSGWDMPSDNGASW